MIRLRSIGQCVVEVGDTKLTPKAETIFAVALYIVLEGGRPISRRELKEVLWPGVTEQRANHCLRQALYKLNALGAALRCERTHVVLPQRSLHSDCAPLFAVQNAAELERLADGITGPFLPGYAPAFSAPFSEWLERKRDHVSAALRRVLVSGIAAKRARGEWSRAESLAATCLGIDPLNEEATLAVAEAAAMQGSKVRALAILDRYLEEIGSDSAEIRSPALALRRRIAEPGPREPMPVRRTPHVGREAEVAELMRLLQRAAAAQGSIAVVWGEPGIGKTRLATEVSRAAALQRVQVATMGCQAHDERRPLSAFMDLVPKLLELRGALGSSPDSIKYLKRLIAHDPAETTLSPDSRESELLFALIRRALFDLLDAIAAEARLLVIVEDVHWLDAASWELLRDLGPWVQSRQLVIVLTSRREEVVERLAGPEHPAPVAVHVTPLRESAMLELWRNITGGTDRERDEEFRDWCVSSAGGNPYYLMELALHSSRVTGAYRAPVELEKLIATRLQALSPVALRVFQACALLGKLSTLDRIEQVLAERRMDLVGALDELERRGFIDSDGTRVSIKHDILGVTAVRMLSQTSLTLLHRHAAMVLEREMEGSKSTEVLWECAEHWRHVGEREHALELLRTCARHALEIGVPGEAVRILEHATSLATDSVQLLPVLQEQNMALYFAAQWDTLLSSLERTTRLRRKIDPSQSVHNEEELLTLEAKWRCSLHPANLVGTLLECAASSAASNDHRISAATLGIMLADNLASASHAQAFYQHVRELLHNTSTSHAARDTLLMVYNCSFGDLPVAVTAARSLVDTARVAMSSANLSRCLRHASIVYEVGGLVDAAKSAATEAFQIAEHLQLAGAAAGAAARMTKIHLQTSDVASAEEWNNRAMYWISRCSDGVHLAHVYMDQAHIACLRGTYDEAERLVRMAGRITAHGTYRQKAHAMAVETLLKMRLKRKPPSNNRLDRMFELHQHLKHHHDQDFFVSVLAEACEAAGRSDEFWEVFVPFVTQTRRDRSPLIEPLRQLAISGGLALPAHLR